MTAAQLLWTNIIADGPPALGLGFDRNDGVMMQMPRDPKSPPLDRATLAFISLTGIIKAVAGGVLLVVLQLFGYGIVAIRTAAFLFESLAQPFFAYPARRIRVMPRFNLVSHLAVGFGVVPQVLTISLPFLRELLGLTILEAKMLLIITTAILMTWAAAEIYSRIVWMKEKPAHP